MNPLDLALAGLLAFAALLGALKGAARIVASLAGLLTAAWAARRFAPAAGHILIDNGVSETVAGFVGYAAVFALVVVAAATLGWLVTRGLAAAALGWVNRLAGALAGLLLGLLLGAAVILGTATLVGGDAPLLTRSRLAEPVLTGGGWLAAAAPESVRNRVAHERERLTAGWHERQK
ncbi:MAG: hypothetical protein COW73_09055 [Nitrospirae bacterium CG18_big_fil_WC_8_21_14_2_50_70_55]|nr:CvpA family protein [Deltaproteobacteria bacterium]OIP63525.1 MAG: hypothetical protein AUK30_08295 [Nitrospirae bacterium CG2_30_70_394]PIQ04242.1 MAG: hypothetical protein COW73_09055 [Nitrospirae bacterium CG18_big_fil_WC_8_21_14_2_50_70_55]PIU78746.1 MAG: hypothetical protein COS73_06245 [Nitrospirae bacterium CG06_land_8_20_14_3_00_70_43]PIW82540.1 MAG: hypothetical protein COZ96_08160 [Nitrospirae bacterium CG_4_8_14_3_um_filter_70_85]PIX83135.1 MAG: hypothetical protein COZ33_07030 [